MSSVPPTLFRVSTRMSSDLLLNNMRRTSVELLRKQNELTTGLRVNRPSDDPAAIGPITSLRQLLARYQQQTANLERTAAVADVTDAALRDAGDIVLEAQVIASNQIGVGSDTEVRRNQAEIVDGLIDALVTIANRDHLGIALFGGRSSAERPFGTALSGVRYAGATDDLTDVLAPGDELSINTNGVAALGALSGRVSGTVDLDPLATAGTRIADVAGARSAGVAIGAINIDVNGTLTELDLSAADTLGDVADMVNNVLGGAGSLAVTADGFTLTAGGGNTITISDVGAGVTAADLGIAISAAGGVTVGGDVDPRLTELTSLASLGAAVDLTGGLKVTNGGIAKVIDFAAAQTVQDMINAVANSGLSVRLTINPDGSGLDLVNEVSGASMTIGENAGGTTATDLGLRSFGSDTPLSEFNDGLGVRIVAGKDDLRIQLGDGVTEIDVNLDGALTVSDVLAAINAAGGGGVTASLTPDGNGIVLTDNVGGGGDFRVLALNGSFAAQDLGILKNAGASATLDGDDTAPVRPDSVFTHLIMLRDALLADDTRAITTAGGRLQADTNRIAVVRAGIGVRANRIEAERERLENRKVQTASILSTIRDTDYTEAVSRFAQLQQQLEAGLLAAQQNLSLSLLDFLR